jgi:SAM-dependent methyltransferase
MRTQNPVVRDDSSSLEQPDYWWYRARSELLRVTLGGYVSNALRCLDVGSADGPSVGWMTAEQLMVPVDIQSRGLPRGRGVCATALALPFADETFDVVSAFDVIEHCASEDAAIAELARTLAPGGRLLLSVPAYSWAWTHHDVQAGHYRRYTRRRLVAAVERSGLEVSRSTHAFAAVFPFFVADRLRRRWQERRSGPPPPERASLTRVSPAMDRLLMGLCAFDGLILRRGNLPFGSSILLVAAKPAEGARS